MILIGRWLPQSVQFQLSWSDDLATAILQEDEMDSRAKEADAANAEDGRRKQRMPVGRQDSFHLAQV
jgi:hypothetical protein